MDKITTNNKSSKTIMIIGVLLLLAGIGYATVQIGVQGIGHNVISTGNITAARFFGDITGDITGDVTGDVTGDLTGDVTGDVTGDLTGDIHSAQVKGIYYVNADNGSDLVAKNDAYSNQILVLPEGTYSVTETINMDSDNWIVGTGKAIIRPVGNITLFNMSDSFIKVKDVFIFTTNVVGYSGTLFLFDDNYDKRGGWNYIENVYIEGTVNESTGAKAIYLIDDDANGVTWVNVEGVHIKNFDYAVYLNCNAAGGYVNANNFENIQLTSVIHGILLDGEATCPCNGNTFTTFGNINSYYQYGVWLDRAQYNRFENSFYDCDSITTVYNISVNSHKNYFTDALCSEAYISDLGTNNVWYLNDINIINQETDIEHRMMDSVYCGVSISSGSITPTCNYLVVDTEGDIASDYLDCIAYSNQAVVYIQQEHSDRDIVFTDNNCATAAHDIFITEKDGTQGVNLTTINTNDVLMCVHGPQASKGWKCVEIS